MIRIKSFVASILVLTSLLWLSSCGADVEGESSAGNSVSFDELACEENSKTLSDTGEPFTVCENSLSEKADAYGKVDYFNVVALGDSIARGYGLVDPEKECFPWVLTELLGESLGNKTGYLNYAVDGHKTSELLELLEHGAISGIENADLVVISIGANNILSVFTDTLMSFFEKNDIKTEGLVGSAAFRLDESAENENSSVSDEDVQSFFAELNALLVSEKFENEMADGIKALKSELPKILDNVFQKNPDVSVDLMTLYNPFKGFSFGIGYIDASLDLDALAAKWVKLLNAEIKSVVKKFPNVILVDTYEPFRRSEDKMLNAGFSFSPLSLSVDPHPNAMGHRFIAELFLKQLKAK